MKYPIIPQPHLNGLDKVELVDRLLRRRPVETEEFYYGREYKTFSYFHRLFEDMDLESWIELAGEIYLHVMKPGKEGRPPRLARFDFKSSLERWYSVTTAHYCIDCYRKKRALALYDNEEALESHMERENEEEFGHAEVASVIEMMPNVRYKTLMQLRYLEELELDEVAERMNMEKTVLYRTHERARAQFFSLFTRIYGVQAKSKNVRL